MARLQRKRFEKPEEVRLVPKARVDIVKLDDVVVGRMSFEPGWRWSVDVRPIAKTEWCVYHHMGYNLSGTLRVELVDGTTLDIRPGDAYEIPPEHDAWVVGDEPLVQIDFAGMRTWGKAPDTIVERVLETIVFTDVVDSTSRATAMGDDAWRDLISRLHEAAQNQADRFRGRIVKSTGDGVFALFDGTARAVRAAEAMARDAAALGLPIRAGVHTGEVEHIAGDARGLAVHVASRVMNAAGPGEVFVSATTRELVADSDLRFEDTGLHGLKGIDGERRLYRLSGS